MKKIQINNLKKNIQFLFLLYSFNLLLLLFFKLVTTNFLFREINFKKNC